MIARNLRGKGVARIEGGVISGGEKLAMKFVRARLGQDLDPPITQRIVLRGKRILVDANFADGRFGRQFTASKSVNVDLAAVGSRRRSGKRLEL